MFSKLSRIYGLFKVFFSARTTHSLFVILETSVQKSSFYMYQYDNLKIETVAIKKKVKCWSKDLHNSISLSRVMLYAQIITLNSAHL